MILPDPPQINALPATTRTEVLVALIARYRRLRTSAGIPDALRVYATLMDRQIDRQLMERALRTFREATTCR